MTFYISARSKDIFTPRSVLVIQACNPVPGAQLEHGYI